MTNSIAEIENNDVLFVIGSNTKESHPIVALRMIKAKRKGAKIIIADPRRVPLVRFADIWIQHKPGTDVALLNGMMHVIMKEGLVKQDFIDSMTEGFDDEFRKNLEDLYPGEGIEDHRRAEGHDRQGGAPVRQRGKRAGIYYTMGITQHAHGTENVFSIANLALMTGNLGKESAGVNPLRGQNNVQGATDMGCIPNMYPGYQRVSIPAIREKFEALWKTKLSDKEGLTATEMLPAARKGIAQGPVHHGRKPGRLRSRYDPYVKALKTLDLLVVQDIFMTETAELAHVVLPGSSFAEKVGHLHEHRAPGAARAKGGQLSRERHEGLAYHHGAFEADGL